MFRSPFVRLIGFVRSDDPCAFLVGVGWSSLALGLLDGFHALLDPSPATTRLVLGAVLASAAVGVYLPHRFAVWVADRLWRQWWSAKGSQARVNRGESEPDRYLQAIVLGGLAVLSGATCLTVRAGFAQLGAGYATAVDRFLVDRLTLRVLEFLLVGLVCGLALVPVGAAWSAVQQFARPQPAWSARLLCGAVTGAGASLLLAGSPWLALTADSLLLWASIPFFALAMLALHRTPPDGSRSAAIRSERVPGAPKVVQSGMATLGACAVWTFASAVVALCVWNRVFGILVADGRLGAWLSACAWLAGLASGLLLARVKVRHRWAWLRSKAFPCAAAGILTAIAAGSLSVLNLGLHSRPSSPLPVLAAVLIAVFLPAAATGLALARSLHSLCAHARNPVAVGPNFVAWLLLAAALGMTLLSGIAIRGFGTLGTLTLVGVAGLLIAGVLLHRAPLVALGDKQRYSAVLVLCGIVMALILPALAGRWMVTRPLKRLALQEGDWLTRSVWAERGDIHAVVEPSVETVAKPDFPCNMSLAAGDALIDWERMPLVGRMLMIGHPPVGTGLEACPPGWTLDRVRFDPNAPRLPNQWFGRLPEGGFNSAEPAARFLRRAHRQYDLVVVDIGDAPVGAFEGRNGATFLDRAVRCLRSEGSLVLVSRYAEATRREFKAGLMKLGRLRDREVAWRGVSILSDPHLAIAIGRGAAWRHRWPDWAMRSSASLDALLAELAPPTHPGREAADSNPGGLASAGSR